MLDYLRYIQCLPHTRDLQDDNLAHANSRTGEPIHKDSLRGGEEKGGKGRGGEDRVGKGKGRGVKGRQ